MIRDPRLRPVTSTFVRNEPQVSISRTLRFEEVILAREMNTGPAEKTESWRDVGRFPWCSVLLPVSRLKSVDVAVSPSTGVNTACQMYVDLFIRNHTRRGASLKIIWTICGRKEETTLLRVQPYRPPAEEMSIRGDCDVNSNRLR